MARVRVLTMKFPRVTKIGQSIASMRTTPQVSGLGPVTVYIARFKCRAGLDPDRAYLFQLGSAHQKVEPGRARSTRLHCHLFCRAVLDPGRALSICGSVNVAYVKTGFVNNIKNVIPFPPQNLIGVQSCGGKFCIQTARHIFCGVQSYCFNK